MITRTERIDGVAGAGGRAAKVSTVQVDLDGLWVLLQFMDEPIRPVDQSDDCLFRTGLPRLLEAFRAHDVRATFFVNAVDLADHEKRVLLQRVVEDGHELANHGLDHRYFHRMSSAEKERQVRESTAALMDFAGYQPAGFRAAGWGVDPELPGLLQRYGYRYDSSTFPTAIMPLLILCHYLFRRTGDSPRPWLAPMLGRLRPYCPSPTDLYRRGTASFLEIPVSTFPFVRLPLHFSYGAQLGKRYLLAGLRCALQRIGIVNFVFHLLDVADPIVDGRFRRLPGVGLPLSYRMDLVEAVLRTLRAAGPVVTTRDLAHRFASRNGV